jgi:hypothetical protein
MQTSDDKPTAHRSARVAQKLTLLELMLVIAGIALGLWLVINDVRDPAATSDPPLIKWAFGLVGVLGGIAALGPVLLLLERLKTRERWGPGKILWFSEGMASWLLWPPVLYHRAVKGNLDGSTAWVCYFYGTPLMAIYVTAALLAGGWFRRRGRRFKRLSWREQFGLIMNLLWATTGLYVLYLIYREEW